MNATIPPEILTAATGMLQGYLPDLTPEELQRKLNETESDTLTRDQAMQYLDCSESTLWRLTYETHQLQAIKNGTARKSKIRYIKSSIIKYRNKNQQQINHENLI